MSDVTTTPEEVTPLVEVSLETPTETPTSDEPEITEQDLQDLIDRIMVDAPESPQADSIPTSPQFAGEKDPLTETIEQLDKLVDQTVALEQEKNEVVAQVTTLEEQVNTLQTQVDYVDTIYAKLVQVMWPDLIDKITDGELADVPQYLIPWKMDAVLADKILWPLVQAHLEGRGINIPKFLGEIVASKKAAFPSITSAPEPTPTQVAPKESLMAEVTRLSNLWF